jgi:hypothetical protein
MPPRPKWWDTLLSIALFLFVLFCLTYPTIESYTP